MEQDDRLKAAHEEETEYLHRAEVIPIESHRRFNGPVPKWVHQDEVDTWQTYAPRAVAEALNLPRTVSVVHDGTWRCEKKLLLTHSAIQGESTPRVHITVWNRPRGWRGRYLAVRSRLWQWQRTFLWACDRIGRLVAGR
jgi:hypothetical protein